jgi:hypothetical protein
LTANGEDKNSKQKNTKQNFHGTLPPIESKTRNNVVDLSV